MRVLVTGGGGHLGAALARAAGSHEVHALSHRSLDVTDQDAVAAAIGAIGPDVIIHAAAWTDVDGCERDPARAHTINVEGTRAVADAAGERLVIMLSTDYVFDGTAGRAYREDDEPRPIQVYGETKRAAERLLEGRPGVAIIRTAWLYGPAPDAGPPRGFVGAILAAAGSGPVSVIDDQVGSPTPVADLSRVLLAFAASPVAGVFHVAAGGEVSRYDFARAIVAAAGLDPSVVHPIATADAQSRAAARPGYAPLDSSAWAAAGFAPIPPWEEALARAMPDILTPS